MTSPTYERVTFTAQPYRGAMREGDARNGSILVGDEGRWGRPPGSGIDDDIRIPWVSTDFPDLALPQVPEVLISVRPGTESVVITSRFGASTPFSILVDRTLPDRKSDTHREVEVEYSTASVIEIDIQYKGGNERLLVTLRPVRRTRAIIEQLVLGEPGTQHFSPRARADAARLLRDEWWVPGRGLVWRSIAERACAVVPLYRRAGKLEREAIQHALQDNYGGSRKRSDNSKHLARTLYKRDDDEWSAALKVLGLNGFYLDPTEVRDGSVGHSPNARWLELFGVAEVLLDSGVVHPEELPSIEAVLGPGWER